MPMCEGRTVNVASSMSPVYALFADERLASCHLSEDRLCGSDTGHIHGRNKKTSTVSHELLSERINTCKWSPYAEEYPLICEPLDCWCAIVPAQVYSLLPPIGSATTDGATGKRKVGNECHIFRKPDNSASCKCDNDSVARIGNPVNPHSLPTEPVAQIQTGS